MNNATIETNIGDTTFKLSKIVALEQVHVFRRAALILSEVFAALSNEEGVDLDAQETREKAIAKLINGIGDLSDEQANYMIFHLLKTAKFSTDDGKTWARLVTGNEKKFSFMLDSVESDAIALMTLVYEAGRLNYEPFLQHLEKSPALSKLVSKA